MLSDDDCKAFLKEFDEKAACPTRCKNPLDALDVGGAFMLRLIRDRVSIDQQDSTS